MKKIGEYADYKNGVVIHERVEVFKTKRGKLRVWEGVSLVAGILFTGRRILDFETSNYINRPALYDDGDLILFPVQNNSAQIITDPSLWILGKNKPKNN